MADDAPVDALTMTDAEFDAAMKARSWRVPQEPSGPVRLTREDVLALSEADLRTAERRRDWRRPAAKEFVP
jgi:ribosomal protein L39E